MVVKRKLSMPYWCVGNPVGDPFGPGVLDGVSSLEITDIVCDAKKKGLIDFTAAHDDDLVTWNPENHMDDQDKNSETFKTLKEIKERLEKADLKFIMATCNLHGNTVFRNGGLSNPDPRVRLLAAQKVMRSLRIGNFLGAEYFTYWVARDGFETQFAVPWEIVYQYIMDGLNLAKRYAKDNKLSIKHGTIEYKPNEPRGEMFLPTAGHSLALISQLEDSDFWGVNPEILQHDQMTSLSSVTSTAFAANLGKLFFLHVGNQKPNQFDNDNPVMVGMDGIKEFISVIYILNRMNWQGHIEFDNHMLRTDATPGEKNRIDLRKRYVELAVDGYRTAERKANELLEYSELKEKQDNLWNLFNEINNILKAGDFAKINNTKIDYKKVNEKAIDIGGLDMLANKKILGM